MLNRKFTKNHTLPGVRFLFVMGLSLLLPLGLTPVTASAMTPSSGRELATVHDFFALGAEARKRRLPILVSVSQGYCPFCDRIRAEILRPMVISGDYDDRVLIREFFMDSTEKVRDFDGKRKAAGDIADGYRVWVTPTLLFLGPDGRELNPRILGINTPEMYGYYVDEAIDASLQRLQDGAAPRYTPSPKDIGASSGRWDDLSE